MRVSLEPADSLQGAIARGLYPLDFAHWRGPKERIVKPVLAWLQRWAQERGNDPDANANAKAVRHADGPDLDVFFVSRVRSRSRAEGFGGVIAAFEKMGEIICSRSDERELQEQGRLDYSTIAGMLEHVAVAL